MKAKKPRTKSKGASTFINLIPVLAPNLTKRSLYVTFGSLEGIKFVYVDGPAPKENFARSMHADTTHTCE